MKSIKGIYYLYDELLKEIINGLRVTLYGKYHIFPQFGPIEIKKERVGVIDIKRNVLVPINCAWNGFITQRQFVRVRMIKFVDNTNLVRQEQHMCFALFY